VVEKKSTTLGVLLGLRLHQQQAQTESFTRRTS
jgi:hypothetical protein